MKYRKLCSCFFAILLALSLTGCKKDSAPVAPVETTAPVETIQPTASVVLDMAGREVAMTKPAERIVTLTAGDCEILCAIGGESLLVGRGEYCDYPESVLSVPSVQSGSGTNIEQVLALSPDLVIMSTMDQTEEQIKAIEDAGIPVAVTNADDIDGVYTAIRLIGSLTNRASEAETLVERMEQTFADVRQKAAGRERGTVYFEVSPLEYGLWTSGSGTFMDELAGMLGLTNAFSDVTGWGQISEEQVLSRNPDYIVTIAMYFGEGPTPEEEILARPGWEGVTAIQQGHVFNIDSNAAARPGPRLADAAQELCRRILGE